jgi:hypothetical protein
MPPTLSTLPAEIIYEIADCLALPELNALLQTIYVYLCFRVKYSQALCLEIAIQVFLFFLHQTSFGHCEHLLWEHHASRRRNLINIPLNALLPGLRHCRVQTKMPITLRNYCAPSYNYPNFFVPLTPQLYWSLRVYHSSVIQTRLRKLSLLRYVLKDLLFIAEMNANKISDLLLTELFQDIENGETPRSASRCRADQLNVQMSGARNISSARELRSLRWQRPSCVYVKHFFQSLSNH